MRRKIIVFVSLIFMFGVFNACVPSEEAKMKQEIEDLVELEKTVIEKTKVLMNQPDSTLQKEVDSLGSLLRTKGLELRQRYQQKGKIEEFEKKYNKYKEKLMKK